MSRVSLLLIVALAAPSPGGEPTKPRLIVNPGAFPTLVNPKCSHCRDEAKRRAGELRDNDRVLCWIRGYSDGGAVPLRFFLNPYRVISDTYGVFVHDPEAGYARGFAASLDFTFHGWRNGVMVMKHKDGTLFSCLSGVAFAGPRKGQRLAPVPTLVSDWGFWLKHYPHAVAYHMFDKYRPVELPARAHPDSLKSRGSCDPRLPADTAVLGVFADGQVRAYRLADVEKAGLIVERVGSRERVILWQPSTRTAVAYRATAASPNKKGKLRDVSLRLDRKDPAAPFVDEQTGSRWDIAGRGVAGELKGWTLTWLDGTQVKWFAWSAEHPKTSLYEPPAKRPSGKRLEEKVREIAGTAEFLRYVPKHFARLEAVDAGRRRVRLLIEGERLAKVWTLTDDAEIKVHGWWGRLDQLEVGDRVWAWFKLDRRKQPVAVMMLADELSEQDIHGPGVQITASAGNRITFKPVKGAEFSLTVPPHREPGEPIAPPKMLRTVYVQSAGGKVRLLLDTDGFEALRAKQRAKLAKRWAAEGLPGTVTFLHLSGESDFMLDHEAIRWGRSLEPGDKVFLQAEPPIPAVVKQVRPWRERTQLRLVIHGLDQADLKLGERLRLKMTPPSKEVLEAKLPPDVDRPRSREERLEWFLASIYCTCPVKGDRCTGMFYTLASCNPNGCGMPHAMRLHLSRKIDRGLTDRQIFEEMLKTYGPTLVRPHLLP